MASLRWAVLGTGAAARSFAAGLRSAPGHEVVVVGSRDDSRGQSFARSAGLTAVVAHPFDAVRCDVDAVYIATPPATHLPLALAAIEAGRPVLVEKPFATTAQDAERIADEAGRRGVFCMEAMWTHFLPLPRRLATLVSAGVIGELTGITASFGRSSADSPHLLDPALGGGALLDRGVYPVSFAVRALGEPDGVEAAALPGPTGVDLDCALILTYAAGALVTINASLRADLANDLRYTGTRGSLHVRGPIYRPVSASLRANPAIAGVPSADVATTARSRLETRLVGRSGLAHGARQAYAAVAPESLLSGARPIWRPYRGNGYHYQALEVARCLAANLVESPVLPLADTVATLRTLDRARAAWMSSPSALKAVEVTP